MHSMMYWYMQSAAGDVHAALHVAILMLLGILGQCAPVYPYVDMSGVTTLVVLGIHGMLLLHGSAGRVERAMPSTPARMTDIRTAYWLAEHPEEVWMR